MRMRNPQQWCYRHFQDGSPLTTLSLREEGFFCLFVFTWPLSNCHGCHGDSGVEIFFPACSGNSVIIQPQLAVGTPDLKNDLISSCFWFPCSPTHFLLPFLPHSPCGPVLSAYGYSIIEF